MGRPKLYRKPFTGTLSPEMRDRVDAYAKATHRTRSDVIEDLIRDHVPPAPGETKPARTTPKTPKPRP